MYDHLLLLPWQNDRQRSYNYPWPSDHSAVLCTATVTPVTAPSLISVHTRRVLKGDDILVRVLVPKGCSWTVVIVKANDSHMEAISGIYDEKIRFRRCMRFNSEFLNIGEYDAVLVNPISEKEEKRCRFVVYDVNVKPNISIGNDNCVVSLSGNSDLIVHIQNAPGNRYDFLAIYESGNPDLNGHIAHVFIGGCFNATRIFNVRTHKMFSDPLEPGLYDIKLLRNEELYELARAKFQVVSS